MPSSASQTESALAHFRRQARQLIARGGGVDSMTRMQVFDLAREQGISSEQYEQVLKEFAGEADEGLIEATEAPPLPPTRASNALNRRRVEPSSPPPIPRSELSKNATPAPVNDQPLRGAPAPPPPPDNA